MIGPRSSMAIHEAGHAVISHVLGHRIMHAVLWDERHGEVVPQCSVCETCKAYYEKHNPAEDPHSRRIQDDLRRAASVAVAGEIVERLIMGDHYIDQMELEQDGLLARSRASAIHLWSNQNCYLQCSWRVANSCPECGAYLESLRNAVNQIISDSVVKSAIKALAEELEKRKRMSEDEIESLLNGCSLINGSYFAVLPPAPAEREHER